MTHNHVDPAADGPDTETVNRSPGPKPKPKPPEHSTVQLMRPELRDVSRPVKAWRPALIVLNGLQEGARFLISKPEMILGRASDADVPLQDEGVSRRHARLVYENHAAAGEAPVCSVQDLGSRNGVAVNGKALTESRRLRERDRITLGTVTLGFFFRDQEELSGDLALYEKATRDALTGLDNRHKLLQSLDHHLPLAERHGYPVSVLVVDVDHFKKFNDAHGHDVGDMALMHVAGLMLNEARGSDLVARWGGEEFVVVLPHISSGDGAQAAERIRAAIERNPLRLGDLEIPITVSIGIATYVGGESREDLFKRADRRVYLAKEAGRNRVVVEE